MATIKTINAEGAFDSTVRTQVNTNFTNVNGGLASIAAGTQALTGVQFTVQPLAGATDAIPATAAGVFVVTSTGVDAMTLAAPTVDGLVVIVSSETAHAHTITATALLATGGSGSPYTTATFAAKIGAGVVLMSANGLWSVLASGGITFS